MNHGSVASSVALGILLTVEVAVADPEPLPQPPATAAPDTTPSDAPASPAPPPAAGTSGATTDAPAPVTPAPARPVPAAPTLTPLGAWPEPGNDAAELKRQANERPAAVQKAGEGGVFAEDWWSHARPILELHGNFRVRAELFYKFSLGRIDNPSAAIWPRPPDSSYSTTLIDHRLSACTQDEAGTGSDNSARNATQACTNNTQAGANLRFRLNPELHISDNLRVMSQIDLLDNIVLGSTPNDYANVPTSSSSGSGYAVAARSGYTPLGFFSSGQSPPRSGVNSLRDSISVKRAWAEYTTPVGELRFGRMPNHWGLGMLYNSGDGYDDDYQQTVDRISFTTGIKALDLYVTGAWDYVNEGATSDTFGIPTGQPYDVAQYDDVTEYMAAVARRKSPELTRLALARGEVVVNGGFQIYYRKQLLAADATGPCDAVNGSAVLTGCSLDSTSGNTLIFRRRGASAWTPDLWLQLLHKKFRFELEAASIQGSLQNVSTVTDLNLAGAPSYKLRQYGLAAEIEQKLVEDKLRLGFNFGWASGDADVNDAAADGTPVGGLKPPPGGGIQNQHGDHTISTFRFDPSYRLDLILYRNILSRVQGTYYFRPSVQYDFLRDAAGQKLGGGFAAIWSRASEFTQSPGHARDLGVELDVNLYFQAKDGALNDDPNRMGGFFTKLEYGVLFPMAGLGYPPGTAASLAQTNGRNVTETSAAQTFRWYLGVMF